MVASWRGNCWCFKGMEISVLSSVRLEHVFTRLMTTKVSVVTSFVVNMVWAGLRSKVISTTIPPQLCHCCLLILQLFQFSLAVRCLFLSFLCWSSIVWSNMLPRQGIINRIEYSNDMCIGGHLFKHYQ
jgi:hypothetical protein